MNYHRRPALHRAYLWQHDIGHHSGSSTCPPHTTDFGSAGFFTFDISRFSESRKRRKNIRTKIPRKPERPKESPALASRVGIRPDFAQPAQNAHVKRLLRAAWTHVSSPYCKVPSKRWLAGYRNKKLAAIGEMIAANC